MVMLEWGACGQMAVLCPDSMGDDPVMPTGDEPCLGYAFYAPPGAVPRARHFPSGPVSADAVLLTTLGVESSTAQRRCPAPSSPPLSVTSCAAACGRSKRSGARPT